MINSCTQKAFTLSEVLITITILGVVSILIIPNMVQRYNERTIVTKVKMMYTMIDKIVTYAQIEKGPISTWDIGISNTSQGVNKVYQALRPYMDVYKDCGNTLGQCFSSNQYKLLDGRNAWFGPSDKTFKSILLKNGIAMLFWSNGNQNCRSGKFCFSVFIDINGPKAPNKYGVDFFLLKYLYAIPEKTDSEDKMNKNDIQCNVKSKSGNRNGRDCKYWILYKGNMDYLRRDITNELKLMTE